MKHRLLTVILVFYLLTFVMHSDHLFRCAYGLRFLMWDFQCLLRHQYRVHRTQQDRDGVEAMEDTKCRMVAVDRHRMVAVDTVEDLPVEPHQLVAVHLGITVQVVHLLPTIAVEGVRVRDAPYPLDVPLHRREGLLPVELFLLQVVTHHHNNNNNNIHEHNPLQPQHLPVKINPQHLNGHLLRTRRLHPNPHRNNPNCHRRKCVPPNSPNQ